MEKKAVCKSCISDLKPYQGQYGTQYTWNSVFENGDKGMTKTNTTNAPFEVGKECEYDIEEIPNKAGTGTYFKIKKVSQNKMKKDFDPTVKLRSFSVSYASRYVMHDMFGERNEKEIKEEDTESYTKFLSKVKAHSSSFFKLMQDGMNVYGVKYADVYGTSLSNAIEAYLEGKIRKDQLTLFYWALLDSVLVKPQTQPQQ